MEEQPKEQPQQTIKRRRPKGSKDWTPEQWADYEQRAANAKKPRVRLFLENRDELREAKKTLAKALARHGVQQVAKIIEDGPGESDAQNKLWQYAMNFAAERGGLPRITEMDLVTAEGVPPIVVQLSGFQRPSDV